MKSFQHRTMKIHLFEYVKAIVFIFIYSDYITSSTNFSFAILQQVMSTLLGCVIAEHCSIINSGLTKCSESFMTHLLRMIMV